MPISGLIRHRDLLNRLVIDRATTEELGHVEQLWMHPPAHRVLGFICKSGPLTGQKYAFNLKQIYQVGPASIVTQSEPTATNTSEVQLLESLIGLEVWSEGGAKIGKIIDCLFELRSGQITQYLFRSEGWRGFAQGIYVLPTGKIRRFGKKRVLVVDDLTHTAELYQEGVVEKLAKVRDRIQDSYIEATHHAVDQLTQVTDTAAAQMESIRTQATEKMTTLRHQLTDETQALARNAQERGQSWLNTVQAQAQTLNTELKSEILSCTDPSPSAQHTNIDPLDPTEPVPASHNSSEDHELDWDNDAPNNDWSVGLADVPLADLEDDEPWI